MLFSDCCMLQRALVVESQRFFAVGPKGHLVGLEPGIRGPGCWRTLENPIRQRNLRMLVRQGMLFSDCCMMQRALVVESQSFFAVGPRGYLVSLEPGIRGPGCWRTQEKPLHQRNPRMLVRRGTLFPDCCMTQSTLVVETQRFFTVGPIGHLVGLEPGIRGPGCWRTLEKPIRQRNLRMLVRRGTLFPDCCMMQRTLVVETQRFFAVGPRGHLVGLEPGIRGPGCWRTLENPIRQRNLRMLVRQVMLFSICCMMQRALVVESQRFFAVGPRGHLVSFRTWNTRAWLLEDPRKAYSPEELEDAFSPRDPVS
ncbi:Hypothetical predicted protein [Pelobates cultripes]|uniref:Uncharacterized protein n=1 Tax=Pelobates cultripes TaxID=61616 RepID=A0AAD1SWZ6_PELCU|nr:Hypothetical predicted protein [Pelobates cultripes]